MFFPLLKEFKGMLRFYAVVDANYTLRFTLASEIDKNYSFT